MKQTVMLDAVRLSFQALQDSIVAALGDREPSARFEEDLWTREDGTGGGRTRVIAGGSVLEKGGVNFSEVWGPTLPAPATASRPHLANQPFHVLGVSLVIHPLNPYVPTSHMNIRFFTAGAEDEARIWWFGGGFDLTPFYPFREDAIHWHRTAKAACDPWGEELYPEFKATCDRYFHLPHRGETRGIGGLFFDDFTGEGFDHAFGLTRSVGEHYLTAYLPILDRRKDCPYTGKERDFQLYRRGRYAEFNLLYDRGTHFGLQSGGRTESILMSLPPLARWDYARKPTPGSPEAVLYAEYLKPHDWAAEPLP